METLSLSSCRVHSHLIVLLPVVDAIVLALLLSARRGSVGMPDEDQLLHTRLVKSCPDTAHSYATRNLGIVRMFPDVGEA
jgi:hypothetical protein